MSSSAQKPQIACKICNRHFGKGVIVNKEMNNVGNVVVVVWGRICGVGYRRDCLSARIAEGGMCGEPWMV